MIEHFNPSVSIEKFAAYLDGNLPENEMLQIASLIENDETLKSILDVSKQVDTSLEEYLSGDLQIPEELLDLDFELPSMPDMLFPSDIASVNSILTPDVASYEEEFHFTGGNSNAPLYNADGSDNNTQDYSGESNSDDFSDSDDTQIPFNE